jgi:hypothetical protein
MNWKGFRISCHGLVEYPEIFLEGLRKTTKNLGLSGVSASGTEVWSVTPTPVST